MKADSLDCLKFIMRKSVRIDKYIDLYIIGRALIILQTLKINSAECSKKSN